MNKRKALISLILLILLLGSGWLGLAMLSNRQAEQAFEPCLKATKSALSATAGNIFRDCGKPYQTERLEKGILLLYRFRSSATPPQFAAFLVDSETRRIIATHQGDDELAIDQMRYYRPEFIKTMRQAAREKH